MPATSSSVYRYNPRTNSWIEVAPMLSPRLDFCLVSTKDAIYAIGGINPKYMSETTTSSPTKLLDSVECYRPYSNTWKSCTSLVKPIQNGRGVYVNGRIYVMDSTGCLQRFCLVEGKWKFLTRLHRCRKIHVVFAWKGMLHILLSEVGCHVKCTHLYLYHDDDDQNSCQKLSSGACKKKESLQMAATCLRLDSETDVTAGFVHGTEVVVITSQGGRSVWNGKQWTILKGGSGRELDNDRDTCSPLQPCAMRLPRYLMQ